MTKMIDKELNMVAGGNVIETSTDSYLLYGAGYMSDMYTEGDLIFNWVEDSAKVDEGWSRVGVTCVSSFVDFNKYYKDGKQISRGEAIKMLG
ncbi:MAG: hypothetical protein K6F87_05110 [Lachnospiraceae bacterium]|nr:hypothetical protein [Lachnospiraceae bacterium]